MISEKGLSGYIKHIFLLKNYLKNNYFDIVHAHYSFSGIVGSFSRAKPLIVSLMGSDIYEKRYYKFLLHFFCRFIWKVTIVKSLKIKDFLGFSNVCIIPNGVNMELFRPGDKNKAVKTLGWDTNGKHILFGSDPSRQEKNFPFLNESLDHLKNVYNISVHTLVGIPHKMVPVYMNASDVLVVVSQWEGSPNVVKEAMACNCPIISTDVGDVKWILGNTKGCYITSYNPKELAEKVKMTIESESRTRGRERLLALGLDSDSIAKKLIKIYDGLVPLK